MTAFEVWASQVRQIGNGVRHPPPTFIIGLVEPRSGVGATPAERRSWRYRQQGADNQPPRGGAQASARDPEADGYRCKDSDLPRALAHLRSGAFLGLSMPESIALSTPDQTAAGRTDRSSSRL